MHVYTDDCINILKNKIFHVLVSRRHSVVEDCCSRQFPGNTISVPAVHDRWGSKPQLPRVFFHSLIRLVYGDTWARKANGVINLAAENKMRELSTMYKTVFAAGHRTVYKTDLRNFDVLFRKLLRSVVGPPAGMDWTRP